MNSIIVQLQYIQNFVGPIIRIRSIGLNSTDTCNDYKHYFSIFGLFLKNHLATNISFLDELSVYNLITINFFL